MFLSAMAGEPEDEPYSNCQHHVLESAATFRKLRSTLRNCRARCWGVWAIHWGCYLVEISLRQIRWKWCSGQHFKLNCWWCGFRHLKNRKWQWCWRATHILSLPRDKQSEKKKGERKGIEYFGRKILIDPPDSGMFLLYLILVISKAKSFCF